MDFAITQEQLALQVQARDWLSAHVPADPLPSLHTAEGFAAHREWERLLQAHGWSAPAWPVEYGGRGADPVAAALVQEEFVLAGAPERLQPAGLALFGPIIAEIGTPEQRDRWLAAILTCETLWCQGFSEPGAGSDLAGLRTKGEVTSEGIVVSGQKTWVTRAPIADRMFALVRTDPGSVRHRGLSFVTIDLRDPGVEVRPIRHIDGEPEFGDVFLDEVVVPHADVVGEIGNGWRVAMSTLSHERGGGGLHTPAHLEVALNGLVDRARRLDVDGDPVIRQAVAGFAERTVAYRAMVDRTLGEVSHGHVPGSQALMGKLWWSELEAEMHDLGLRLDDVERDLGNDDPTGSWLTATWRAKSGRVFAGTSEIQRSIIGERVLGLPKEPRNVV